MSYSIPARAGTEKKEYTSSGSHQLIEPGWHEMEVVDATDVDVEGKKLVTRSGDPRIKVRVSLLDGNQSFWHFLYLTPKAFFMVWEFLDACGINSNGAEFVLDPQDLVGKRFRAEVYVQDGWNRLKKPLPLENEQKTPDPETPAPQPAPAPASTPVEEDDVPF